MPDVYRRLTLKDVGTTRTRIGAYTVPAGGVAQVIGVTLCNTAASSINVDFELFDGTTYFFICDALPLAVAQTLAPVGQMNKLVLQAGDGVFARSSAATSLDVIVSILERTP
jgi:hypothetical protein